MRPNQPLTRWKCDRCGEWIEGAASGYVIWGAHGHDNAAFEIIHQGKCDDRTKTHSAALGDFLGSDGLAYLTSLLSYGVVKNGMGVTSSDPLRRVHDIDQFVDFMRRVQVPFYEEARPYLLSPEAREHLSDANEVYPYLQEHLQGYALDR